jgi:hypothetical protein
MTIENGLADSNKGNAMGHVSNRLILGTTRRKQNFDSNGTKLLAQESGNDKGQRAITSTIFMVLLFSVTVLSFARPVPQAVHTPTPLQLVGEGSMTWFGFTLYDASLWTATGKYDQFQNDLPIALHITYDKNIAATKLAETTVEEWERLEFFDPQSRNKWGHKLSTIWPDVKPGDSITTLVTNEKHTIFYANDVLIGRINDENFSYALISIWLHPNTTAPTLRANLIGINKV